MLTDNRSIDHTLLLFRDGRWCLGYWNCGPDSKHEITMRVEESADDYWLFVDDICSDLIMYKANGKWGFFPKVRIIGQGEADYASLGPEPFVYDNFLFLTYPYPGVYCFARRQSPEFYRRLRGLIAVQQDGLWGMVKTCKREWVPILVDTIVDCRYATIQAAADSIPDLTDYERYQIRTVLHTPTGSFRGYPWRENPDSEFINMEAPYFNSPNNPITR